MIENLLRKSVRDLRASLAQTIALIVIVALGIASFVALIGAYRDLGTSYNHTYERLHFADATFSVQAAPQSVVAQVAGVDGVAEVTGRLIVDGGLELSSGVSGTDGGQIRSRLIGLPPDHHPQVNDLLVLDGRYLGSNDSQVTLLESHFAKIHHLGPGDNVTPIVNGQKISLQVIGVAASPEYLIVSPSKQEIMPSARTFAVLFVPLPELQSLVGMQGQVNDLDILLSSGADQATVIKAVEDELSPYGLLTTTLQADQPSAAALRLDLEGYREIASLMPTLILLVAAGSVYVMLGRQVRAQQPQIGLMKALGYGNRAIVGHYLVLAFIIALIGSVLGIIIGIPLELGITTAYADELGIPLVQTHIYPDLMAGGVLLSLLVATLAGLGPARGAARMAPATAMRLDPAAALAQGRPSFVERWMRLPLWLRLPLRNVFRVRRRSLSTGLGVVFAFVLVLMSWGMIDSMQYMLQHQFQDVERWDLAATFARPQTASILKEIESWQGVKTVEPLMQLPASLQAAGQQDDVLLTAFDPSQNLYDLHLGGGTSLEQALAQGRIVLTAALADKFKLGVGDKVSVKTLLGSREFTLSGTSDELMSAGAYISLKEAQDWAGAAQETFNGIYLTVDPGRAAAIKADLYQLEDTASVQLKSAIQQDWRSLMGLFYTFMGVMLAFAVAMSFALLFNAMTVNVHERERELATMRAVGTGRTSITRLMTTENLILWLLTLIPGLLLGRWVALQMGAAFQSDLFAFKIVVAPTSYVITAVGILLTMILATLPAIRRVNRLNLADAIKVLT
jgi:putative ABC transport system permease protein